MCVGFDSTVSVEAVGGDRAPSNCQVEVSCSAKKDGIKEWKSSGQRIMIEVW